MCEFQTHIVFSRDPERICLLSGEKQTKVTRVRPVIGSLSASQANIVVSSDSERCALHRRSMLQIAPIRMLIEY